MTTSPREAIVLLSGGLDSTTVLAIAQSQGFVCNCLSFRYGQKQEIELERAAAIARKAGVRRHLVLRIDLDRIGGSALTTDVAVPKGRGPETMGRDIPATYVPGRNILFLAHALSWAEALGVADIFLGINAVDYSGYPDCRPEFLAAFERMAALGTKAGVEGAPIRFHAPLLHLSKKEIIATGMRLGVDYGQTHSCYDPAADGRACGQCDACLLRLKGFREAGLEDPALYVTREPVNRG
ncbi:MAG: 7-cyano-7-deazaguanine synthase QueC [Desulfobulbus sp.]|jgi:7-cyano-7-deazaguanine synthase